MIVTPDFLIVRTTQDHAALAVFDTIGYHAPFATLPWRAPADEVEAGVRTLLEADTPLGQIVAGHPDTGGWIVGARRAALPTWPALMPLVQRMAAAAHVWKDQHPAATDLTYAQIAGSMIPALLPILRALARLAAAQPDKLPTGDYWYTPTSVVLGDLDLPDDVARAVVASWQQPGA